eukprot:TRINITY_DN5079_c0_g2_i3.p1 TRINITY_DN5079_c0_g2~~TRINITY_DN5079_c0_g2_i3.p1  ORF type:complete len:217 (-),score=62.70 TRINITY_DN5079_c0_g2_i3:56-706(-)
MFGDAFGGSGYGGFGGGAGSAGAGGHQHHRQHHHHHPGAGGRGRRAGGAAKAKTIRERDLPLTLPEISSGGSKTVKVGQRNFEVKFDKGVATGHKITTFQKDGHIFVVKPVEHPYLQREGANLIYTANVTLIEALQGRAVVEVKTLEGRSIRVPVRKNIISPDVSVPIAEAGLPKLKKNGRPSDKRGDLIIRFNVKFPKRLRQETVDKMIKALQEN